jgi:hypothetical protein
MERAWIDQKGDEPMTPECLRIIAELRACEERIRAAHEKLSRPFILLSLPDGGGE